MRHRHAHIMIADDHQLFAEGVARILREHGYIISIVTDLTVLEGTLRSSRPNLLLLDLSFGKMSSMPLLRRLRTGPDPLRIIVLSARDEPVIIEAVERTGAPYLAKSRASTDLLAIVRATLTGREATPPAASTATPGAFRTVGVVSLSERQIEVLLSVHEGLSNRAIGTRLGVTPKAIEPHLRALRQRIGVTSRAELARWAETNLDALRNG